MPTPGSFTFLQVGALLVNLLFHAGRKITIPVCYNTAREAEN